MNSPGPLRFQFREYPCAIMGVTDGDTVRVRIDLGLRMFTDYSLRLCGLNSPEIGTEAGQRSREWLVKFLMKLQPVLRVRTHPGKEHDKYGRFLGELLGLDENGKIVNVNSSMIEHGMAEPMM